MHCIQCIAVPNNSLNGFSAVPCTDCCRRQEQKQELGDKDVYIGDISQPDTVREAMQDSDKLVM